MKKIYKLICAAGLSVLLCSPVFGESVPKDFVKVEGTTIKGKIDGSNVFMEDWTKVIIDNLYVCDHEVTQGEYEKYCNYGGKKTPTDSYGKGEDVPAYYVNWYDAILYCNLRSIDEGLTPVYSIKGDTDPRNWKGIVSADGKYCGPASLNTTWNSVKSDGSADGYRLPTEEEWEYIAREQDYNNKLFVSYYDFSSGYVLDEVAWYTGNSWVKEQKGKVLESHPQIRAIKGKKPNNKGIYDMSGNVAEWCWNFSGREDLLKLKIEPAVRGGSAYSSENLCKNVARASYDAFMRKEDVGFRVVRLCLE